MFAGTELAGRIERAEGKILRAGAEAIARRRGVEVLLRSLAGSVAAYTVPGSPLNKLAGLGFGGVPDEADLAALEDEYRARSATLQAEVSTLGDPAIGVLLTRRDYVLQGFENLLGCSLDAGLELPEVAPGLEVEELPPGEQPAWVDVVVTGFMTLDAQGVASHETYTREALEPVIADFSSMEGMRRYLVRRDGEIAGGGSVRFTDGVAHMCGAATLPAHRRHGVQTALLARRLADARAAGCDVAAITTQPGSKSMENAQARGFSLLYSRAVLVRDL